MSPLLSKIIISLIFGVGAVAVLFETSLADGVITAAEWSSIGSAFVVAAWGKFSSNTRFVAPSRKGETIAGPK